VPIGGHNLLEPAALGMPVITGPHTHNAPDIARALITCGAALEVATHEQLARALEQLFTDANYRATLGNRALEFVASNRGALQRLLALIEPSLQ
jgi:3-deoxy-D-manno-octulosonic-acid transferase